MVATVDLKAYLPSTSLVTVETAEGAQLRVMNLNGQLVYQAENIQGRTQIDTEAWPAGVYLLQVQWMGQTQQLKLVVD